MPAALEDVNGGSKVPQSLLEKAAKIRELGGYQLLQQRMQEMPELLKRNKEILDEVHLKILYTSNHAFFSNRSVVIFKNI